MPLHPQAQAVCDLMLATRVEMAPEDRVELTRNGWGLFLGMAGGQPEPVFAVDDHDADGVPVRVYRPSPDDHLPIFVVLHGGGWVIGNVEQFDVIARQLANASGAVVVSVDYRLAPEHPFPAPLDDCRRAVEWAVAQAGEIGGDLGVRCLEADLDVACPLEVRVEGKEVDHPGAFLPRERRDRFQLSEVVADHRHVEPERDAELAEVVERLHLPGRVVLSAPVNRRCGLPDPMDGYEEIVDTGAGVRCGLFRPGQVHAVGDHRGA